MLLALGLLKESSHPFMLLLHSILRKALQAQRTKKKLTAQAEEAQASKKGRIAAKSKGLRPACNAETEIAPRGRAKKQPLEINNIELERLLERQEQLIESQLHLGCQDHRKNRDKAKTVEKRLRGIKRRLREA